ncbi:MAG: PIN domain-containing protein [Xanthomonadales bacterium]|nr:PIN domain-containing protein [Xanthomonadales bacterium]
MILLDLNIVVDVMLRREPHLAASERMINRIANGRLAAAVSADSVSTLYYLVRKYRDADIARQAVDWVINHFEIAPVGAQEIKRAQGFDWNDFEDAVIAAAAESAGCTAIVTRNARDFVRSPVPAMAPEELVISEIHESLVQGYAAKST